MKEKDVIQAQRAIRSNCTEKALPAAVQDFVELLAEIAAKQVRVKPSNNERGSDI